MKLFATEVGKPFFRGSKPPREGVYFEYAEAGPYLIYALHKPKPKEIRAAKTGKIDLALYNHRSVLFLLSKISGIGGWCDSPFSIRIYDGRGMTFDFSHEIKDGQSVGFNIVLVDADTNILLAQRLIGPSTEFSRELRRVILGQLELPFSMDEYNKIINMVYSQYSSDNLAILANVRTSVGSE